MDTELSTPILDDIERLLSVDSRNMLRIIDELPEQCETALSIGRSFVCGGITPSPNVVYLTGVGDNAIAAEMAAAMLGERMEIPVVVSHGSPPPAFVNEFSFAMVIDYNGRNPVTRSNYETLVARGVNTVCLTSGGPLLKAANANGTKCIKVPSGQPTRSAFGYLLIPIMAAAQGCGYVSGMFERLGNAVLLLKNAREEFRFSRPTARNAAKQAAQAIFGKRVMVYGGGSYESTVAVRWRSQINQNSKSAAAAANLLDDADGALSGWERLASGDDICVVVLRDETDSAETNSVVAAFSEVLDERVAVEVKIKGRTMAEKILYGVFLGDYVSCYLAILYGVNPSATDFASALQEKIRTEPVSPAAG